MAKVGSQRGLKNYIQEIRRCTTKDAEEERVQKELGKIRKKYTSDKSMSGRGRGVRAVQKDVVFVISSGTLLVAAYDRKKYLWKLMYTKMLGYDIEFGHKQAMDLMASSSYSLKQVGYIVCGMFLSENDELLRLVINTVRSDLLSRNESFQCLALEFTANVGGPEFAQLLTADVMEVLSLGATRPVVRKKAALCLLRLLRKSDSDDSLLPSQEWGPKIASLLEERDVGVLLGITTLLVGIVSRDYEGYECCIPRLVGILQRLRERDVSQDYTYYGIPSPWLQVKVLRALQYFPPPEDPAMHQNLGEILKSLLEDSESIKNPNKSNAMHGIIFEAAGVAVSLGNEELITLVVSLLARYLSVRESNLRYLALENIGRLSQSGHVAKAVAKHQKTIISCMSDADISIRASALNLLFTTANIDSASDIVEELLSAIKRSDYSMREELVLKAAVLAERFPPSPEWYIDSMINLVITAGDAVTNEIWHSIVHLVSNKKELHSYAAQKVVNVLQDDTANEPFIRCAAYILGEFGNETDTSTFDQYKLLHKYFPVVSIQAKAMLLNCYEKMALRMEDQALQAVKETLELEANTLDTEIQQRATEYKELLRHPEAAKIALQPLPLWEMRDSVLLRKLVEKEVSIDEARERPVWMNENEDFDKLKETETPDMAVLQNEEAVIPSTEAQPTDVIDLLDLSEPQVLTEEISDQEKIDHPGDMYEDQILSGNPFEDQQEVKASTEPIGDIDLWLLSLCEGQSGIFYEDSNIQIGIKMRSSGPDLEMDFYLGNKTNSSLELKKFFIPPSPAFRVSYGDPPKTVDRDSQVQIQSQWTCTAPYVASPIMQINYVNSTGESMARTLTLPLPLTKFCKPVVIPASVFSTRWNQVTGSPYKLQETTMVSTQISKSSIMKVLDKLNLQILDDVNMGVETIFAVSIFTYSAHDIIQVPCMVSISGYGSATLVVTVATADATVSQALKSTLISILGRF